MNEWLGCVCGAQMREEHLSAIYAGTYLPHVFQPGAAYFRLQEGETEQYQGDGRWAVRTNLVMPKRSI
jgi:hypothetical protein